jgi:ketosteroid isomerase-like protein
MLWWRRESEGTTTERRTPLSTETVTPDSSQGSWWEEVYDAVDGKDVTVVDRLFSEDISLKFNYHPAAVGRDAVREAMKYFWSTVGSTKHTFHTVVEQGDTAALEATCTYTRLDGTVVSLPVVTVIDRRDGLVAAQRIYIDMAPLESPELLEH